MGDLSYEELLSELQGLIGRNVQVAIHAWSVGGNERRYVANLGGRLLAGHAADFSPATAELPRGESVLFTVKADGAAGTPPTFFVIPREDFRGATRREPGPGVGFFVGGVFVGVQPAD